MEICRLLHWGRDRRRILENLSSSFSYCLGLTERRFMYPSSHAKKIIPVLPQTFPPTERTRRNSCLKPALTLLLVYLLRPPLQLTRLRTLANFLEYSGNFWATDVQKPFMLLTRVIYMSGGAHTPFYSLISLSYLLKWPFTYKSREHGLLAYL